MQNEIKSDLFASMMMDKFRPRDLMMVHSQLEKSDIRTKFPIVLSLPYKNPTRLFILSLVLGFWGLDRLDLGQTFLAFLKFLTIGGVGVWWFIDLFIIVNSTKKYNYRLFMSKF